MSGVESDDLPDVVKGWVNQAMFAVEYPLTIERGLWLNFCVAVQDGNPLYWDEAAAQAFTGGAIAPPAMLPSWGVEHHWNPAAPGPVQLPMALHFLLKEAFGLPHGVVSEVELILHTPLRAGDSVRTEQVLREVGPEKSTRLGVGRKWTIEVVYSRQDGQLAGIQRLRFFSYRSANERPEAK